MTSPAFAAARFRNTRIGWDWTCREHGPGVPFGFGRVWLRQSVLSIRYQCLLKLRTPANARHTVATMSFREPLPDGCPPQNADAISSQLVVFRLVRSNPPTEDDFRSQRAERPKASFSAAECMARGLSVHGRRDISERMQKLPTFQNHHVCIVLLNVGAGYIQQTGQPSHHTWWPFATFNILDHSEVQES
jgi:hypothetical protein